MTLLEQVARVCRRLMPKGWGRLLALHGLNLDAQTLRDSRKLAKELERRLSHIDRSVKGFEDFSPTGTRAIERGQPGCSLLYHALASPLVHPFVEGEVPDRWYPTLKELDTIENYIYSRANRRASFAAKRVVGVFAINIALAPGAPTANRPISRFRGRE